MSGTSRIFLVSQVTFISSLVYKLSCETKMVTRHTRPDGRVRRARAEARHKHAAQRAAAKGILRLAKSGMRYCTFIFPWRYLDIDKFLA